jgi:thiosulfate reductase cytochrome b subunit
LALRNKIIHPLFVRVTHWINAFAVFSMLTSGWRIYNASPLFEFRFPPEMTLGGWLAGALAWHFAAMWLLVFNGLAYIVYGVVSGHFWRNLFAFGSMPAYRHLRRGFTVSLLYGTGKYNIIQRILYVYVILVLALLVLSGVGIWKPVQLQQLTAFFGGYDQARLVHFWAMLGLVIFLIIHISVGFAVKGTVQSMLTGRLNEHRRHGNRER